MSPNAPPWLWVALTLVAAAAQTGHNAAQRSLTQTLGTAGATHVRFLFGLPFALAFLSDRAPADRVDLAAPVGVVLAVVGPGRLVPGRRDRADAARDARALVRRGDRLDQTEPVQLVPLSLSCLATS